MTLNNNHFEELFANAAGYLSELWENESREEMLKHAMTVIGVTEQEFDYYFYTKED